MRCLAALCLVALLAALPGFSVAVADVPPSFDEIIETLKLDPSVKGKALAGEIVMMNAVDSTEKELAIALVMVVKKPYAEVIEAMHSNHLFEFQENTLDFVEIKGEPDVNQLQNLGFNLAEAAEVRELLAAKAGDMFNLSAQEFAQIEALNARSGAFDDATLIETVNNTIREFMVERLRSYQKMGRKGIATYQRGTNSMSSPAEEIAAATAAVAGLKDFAPNFISTLENLPDTHVDGVEHRFFVFKLNIEGRPGFVLSHVIYFFGPDFSLAAQRHIYAPHFYNSLQLVAGVVPHENNTVVFYGNRTYTDQVSGFGQRIKHSVGGKQLTKNIKSMLADMRAGLEAGTP